MAAVLQNNRANIQRRRARLQRLAVGLQGERINIYANPNHHVPVSAASRASSFSACFFRKANTLLLRLGLLVCGWELVEGTGSSSVRRDTWEGPSPAEVEASAAVWPWLDNGHEAPRVGGWIDGLPQLPQTMAR
ncbi:hypothetical protein KUCAC02_023642 [Chaenocephalus aceratus]|uniref:Uncharacterized protein n=1 Tax=Chaenocephalus aceratus TaxID=36190 RepID=A0ACB9WG91_CHAAC|nr:hypothetical protein KUCAC02_023642 [Chaenocephalus aceratus]